MTDTRTDAIIHTSRYHAAAATLGDCAALARIARAAHAVSASDAPMAVAVAGGRRLRAARRVGLFAGTFNPLTRAHVALVDAARHVAHLDVVIWACAAASVDKERVERAALIDRLAQMRAFVAGRRHDTLALLNRGLYVDEARTVRALLAPAAELLLLVGYDKIVQIFDPRYYANRDAALDALFSLADILVSPRGADGPDALAALLAQPANRPFAAHVRPLAVPPAYANDSSTEARALAARTPPDDAALTRLLPPAGLALALQTGAYGTDAADDIGNAYATRARWLDALATMPPAVTRELPPLATLVARSQADDMRGRHLRAWLDGSREDVALVRALVRGQASG